MTPGDEEEDDSSGALSERPTNRLPAAAPARPTSRPPPSASRTPSKFPSVRPSIRPPTSRAPDLLGSARRLSSLDFDLVNAARRIVEGALGLVLGDHFVVIADRSQETFAAVLVDAAVSAGGTAEIVDLDAIGSRPHRSMPPEIEDALKNAQAGVYLASFVEGEGVLLDAVARSVRDLQLRFGAMPGASRRGILVGFSADPHRSAEASRAVRLRVRPDSTLRLRSAGGSDLTVRLAPVHRWVERVGTVRAGRFDSLPLGQLLTHPAEVSGVYVADASVGLDADPDGGHALRSPVRLEIEGGVVRSVRARDALLERRVELALRREHQLDAVGLVVIGTNLSLDGPTGEMVFDQTLPGLHLSFGATLPELTGAVAGARNHFVVAGAAADVDLDGAPLLRSGRFVSLSP